MALARLHDHLIVIESMKPHGIVPLVLLVSLATTVRADDWPQWRGPNRDGVSKETGLLREWPDGGPKLLWIARDLGIGYSTPSVVAGSIFLISSHDGFDFCQSLDAKTGKKVWETKLGLTGPNKGMQFPGSRATPTVDSDALFALGSNGDLACIATADGKEIWRKSYKNDFTGAMGDWAYAESPLVDGDLVIGTPGGGTATLVALKKSTGDVVWKSHIGDAASYASPIAIQVGGHRQYVQFLSRGVVGIDATTGQLSWRYNKTKDAANMVTSIFHDGYLFTASRVSAALIQITEERDKIDAKEIYYSERVMAVGMGGAVRVGNYLYGTSRSRGDLMCSDFMTGDLKWKDSAVGNASICFADGRIYVRSHKDGTVLLIDATPDGFKEHGRLSQPERTTLAAWPHPVVAKGCLLLRDQGVLICYDIKSPTH